MSNLLTVNEVAERLLVHPNTVYRYIEEGKLKASRVGNYMLRISEASLSNFITERQRKRKSKTIVDIIGTREDTAVQAKQINDDWAKLKPYSKEN